MLIYFPEGLCVSVLLFASFLLICLSLHVGVTSSVCSSKASLRWASSSSSQTKHFSELLSPAVLSLWYRGLAPPSAQLVNYTVTSEWNFTEQGPSVCDCRVHMTVACHTSYLWYKYHYYWCCTCYYYYSNGISTLSTSSPVLLLVIESELNK